MEAEKAEAYIDTDGLLHQALKRAAGPRPDGSSELGDFMHLTDAFTWVGVLAVPRLFGGLGRSPGRDHLLGRVDVILAYARSGQRSSKPDFEGAPYVERESRALRLRELIEHWGSTELPREITDAARDLLYAEGLLPPGGWDNLPDPPTPIEECLSWPKFSP